MIKSDKTIVNSKEEEYTNKLTIRDMTYNDVCDKAAVSAVRVCLTQEFCLFIHVFFHVCSRIKDLISLFIVLLHFLYSS